MKVLAQSLSIFCIVLQLFLLISIFISWLPISHLAKEKFYILVEPMLTPLRYLLRYSIFQLKGIDITPIIAFIVLNYFQNFFVGWVS